MNKATADLKWYAQQFTREAIDCLVMVMRAKKSPPQARALAADKVLDRGHGKAPQALSFEGGSPTVTILVRDIPGNERLLPGRPAANPIGADIARAKGDKRIGPGYPYD